MLHHTAGIYNYTSEPNFVNDGMVHRTTDEMVEFIAKLPKTQDFEPGTNWSYSNSAYFILGGVVEKAAGAPLATVFKTKLFTPLGMAHSALDDETELVPGRVHGYLTARAAVSITRATARGWEMCMKWLPLRTVTFDPARLAIRRAIVGSSSRSSVAMIA